MNNTKWNEIYRSFFDNELRGGMVRWRTKDIETGYVTGWDATWTHFACANADGKTGWDKIEYLQIQLTPENTDYVLDVLRHIHVPGDVSDNIVTVYGYRTDVDYL
ncbi:MAG: hypothetical protein K6G68_07735 [Oscillospiraceae bacterium]|nr:hypothetical protein [Oscillospiraceae bacterium]